LGRLASAPVGLLTWGIPMALLLTGVVLWRDWHALALRGVDGTATIEGCEWRTTGNVKYGRPSSGYYSCRYSYRTSPAGPAHSGSFQSSRERRAGEAEPIRYLRDAPGTSAAAETLRHPSVTAGGMIALGLALLAWGARRTLKRRPT
jgi:hypothetical protein